MKQTRNQWSECIDRVISQMDEDRFYQISHLVADVICANPFCNPQGAVERGKVEKAVRTLLARDSRLERMWRGTYRRKEPT